MTITMNRNELMTAIKQVYNSGKYSANGTLKAGNISDYVTIYAPEVGEEAPVYFINANNFTFVRAVVNTNVEKPVKPTVLNIPSLRKYLGRWKCDEVRMEFGDSFNMWGSGSVTLPLILEHPFQNSLTTFNSNLRGVRYQEPSLFEDNPLGHQSGITVSDRVAFDTCLILDGDTLQENLKQCELVNTGIYTMDWDGETTLLLSSSNNTERYNVGMETRDLFDNNNPATIQITMPLGAFLNTRDKCNLFIKDEFPILIVTETNALIYRAPYRPN
tara:strand:+ start:13109 stop:13927 length:819 start_codon:yes stop_codon:yes gene_type:complete